MVRMRDVPARDRPRERLLARGAEALSDRELLALLLGAGVPGQDAVELAGQLIHRHGSLYELSRLSAHELAAGLPGIGPAKAARVAAAFQLGRRAVPPSSSARQQVRGSGDLATITAPLLRGLRHERVVVVVCDRSGWVLRTAVLTEGATDRSLLPVRDVLALVLATGGTSFGVAHNHPTGCTDPSEADLHATTRLAAGAEAVGLRFLDHVVVTDEGWRRVAPE
ncbi:JAB domain-containing protein [Streptomyces pseudogriseolus]|uniref:JAB domain-containing protein n=1 Tax=Streptomyces pseudogriseolus TaxID=36817 RepID=UPI003FA23B4F